MCWVCPSATHRKMMKRVGTSTSLKQCDPFLINRISSHGTRMLSWQDRGWSIEWELPYYLMYYYLTTGIGDLLAWKRFLVLKLSMLCVSRNWLSPSNYSSYFSIINQLPTTLIGHCYAGAWGNVLPEQQVVKCTLAFSIILSSEPWGRISWTVIPV